MSINFDFSNLLHNQGTSSRKMSLEWRRENAFLCYNSTCRPVLLVRLCSHKSAPFHRAGFRGKLRPKHAVPSVDVFQKGGILLVELSSKAVIVLLHETTSSTTTHDAIEWVSVSWGCNERRASGRICRLRFCWNKDAHEEFLVPTPQNLALNARLEAFLWTPTAELDWARRKDHFHVGLLLCLCCMATLYSCCFSCNYIVHRNRCDDGISRQIKCRVLKPLSLEVFDRTRNCLVHRFPLHLRNLVWELESMFCSWTNEVAIFLFNLSSMIVLGSFFFSLVFSFLIRVYDSYSSITVARPNWKHNNIDRKRAPANAPRVKILRYVGNLYILRKLQPKLALDPNPSLTTISLSSWEGRPTCRLWSFCLSWALHTNRR